MSLLTEEDVKVIYLRLSEGERGAVIARDFAVSQQTISSIKTGACWGHATGLGPPLDTRKRVTRNKLSETHVLKISSQLDLGDRAEELARVYGVSIGTIYNIKYGRSWGWLTGRGKESSNE